MVHFGEYQGLGWASAAWYSGSMLLMDCISDRADPVVFVSPKQNERTEKRMGGFVDNMNVTVNNSFAFIIANSDQTSTKAC